MLPRHANELLTHLEQVADVGCTVIRKKVLVYWYGQQRLTVSIWRDIEAKWLEVLEGIPGLSDTKTPLFAAEGDGVVTLVWGEGLTSNGKWLKPVGAFTK